MKHNFYLKYLLVALSVMSQCFAMAGHIDKTINFIASEHALRCNTFNANPAATSNYSKNTDTINAILRDKSKVSKETHANTKQKKTILQAVMAAEIIRNESSTQARLGGLLPTLKSTDPLYNHFYILNYVENLSKKLVVSVREREFRSIDTEVLVETEKLMPYGSDYVSFEKYSGIQENDFVGWFNEVLESHFSGHNEFFIKSRKDKNSDNKVLTKAPPKLIVVVAHRVSEGQKFNANHAGVVFNLSVKEVPGDGDCGYHAMDLKRIDFVAFLKSRVENLTDRDETFELESLLANALGACGAKPKDVSAIKNNATKEKRLAVIEEIYTKGNAWMTTDDMRFASNMPQFKDKAISVWKYEGEGILGLHYAVRNGIMLIGDDNEFKKIARSNFVHVYFNGSNHYDKLLSVSA